MAKIRKVKSSDIKQIQKMIEYVGPGLVSNTLYENNFTLFPFNMVQEFMPLNLKVLPECYVAVEGKKILGLIGLIPDGKQKTRWKINRLILDAYAYEVGKQLIDYVVNKYGGAGVETFITIIDSNHAEVISLFKDSCSFRSATQIQVWEKDIREFKEPSRDLALLRDVKPSDARVIQDLHAQALFPHFRTSLIKSQADFRFGLKNKLVNKFRGNKVKRMVLENPARNSIEGYFLLMTSDNQNYWADIILSLPYQEYYEDILNYISRYIYMHNDKAKLYVYSRKYYESNKVLIETLNGLAFKLNHEFQVLVKDYWKIAKVQDKKKSPIVVFPDMTSPACNIAEIAKAIPLIQPLNVQVVHTAEILIAKMVL